MGVTETAAFAALERVLSGEHQDRFTRAEKQWEATRRPARYGELMYHPIHYVLLPTKDRLFLK